MHLKKMWDTSNFIGLQLDQNKYIKAFGHFVKDLPK